MKKLTLILIACLIALEYIFIAFLSFKFSKLMNIEAVYKTPYLEVTN
jgi:hypothetical protein